jgi:hypothetical protein
MFDGSKHEECGAERAIVQRPHGPGRLFPVTKMFAIAVSRSFLFLPDSPSSQGDVREAFAPS